MVGNKSKSLKHSSINKWGTRSHILTGRNLTQGPNITFIQPNSIVDDKIGQILTYGENPLLTPKIDIIIDISQNSNIFLPLTLIPKP